MPIKTRKQLIDAYIRFFKSRKHKEIPNSSLVPINDPTVLFTTAGMHPLVPYLTGQKHPLGKRLVNNQRCIRTGDIDEVGDSVHHTFFEMLGNWSLGDYWKKEAIEYSHEFLTKELKIPKSKISVTCFKGDKDSPKDKESAEIWESLGIPKNKIKFLSKEDNWWPTPKKDVTGPCGPDTEMFINNTEIWNDVFMEYNKTKDNKYIPLSQKNVDTGMGVERTLAILTNQKDVYLTQVWKPLIDKIEQLSRKEYSSNKRTMRIIADHIKASVFIIADGIIPSNTQQGYVLRRLLRRATINLRKLNLKGDSANPIVEEVFKIYPDYKHVQTKKKEIYKVIKEEEEKFEKTLDKGLNTFKKLTRSKKLSGKDAFLLFQSYGFPIEMTQELALEKKIKINLGEYQKEYQKHQKLSRTATKGAFSSGLADSSIQTKRLHTATHLLNEALRQILGPEVRQRGSNINSERLRFDFNFPRKLTPEEIKEVENLVNKKIKQNLKIKREELSLSEAIKSGAQSEFGHKYPQKVSVYTILDPSDKRGWFSKEICTGPHVPNTKEIGTFKITKEESSSAGVRRIKAKVQ